MIESNVFGHLKFYFSYAFVWLRFIVWIFPNALTIESKTS